jgi:hypothetical protein
LPAINFPISSFPSFSWFTYLSICMFDST